MRCLTKKEVTVRKSACLVAAIATAFGVVQAFAQTSTPECNGIAVISSGDRMAETLTNKMVCVGSAGAWKNQQYHATGGMITDYKGGPPRPGNKDPTSTVGTWSTNTGATNQGLVTYTYIPGRAFTYMVAMSGTTLYFCTPTTGNAIALFSGTLEPSTTIFAAQACV
jgi:hypothetical protein